MAEQGWQLDEQGARDYEKNLVAMFTDDWAQDLLARVPIASARDVLDVGTGTGIVARRAAELIDRGGRVEAVDVNPAMLAVARELSEDSAVPIRYTRAEAESLPWDDESFDLVVTEQALQFTDAAMALAECRRVARDGASLGASVCRSLDHQPGYRILVDCLEQHVGVEAADIIASPYSLGGEGQLASLVADAGFGDLSTSILVTSTRFPTAAGYLVAETSSSPLGDITRDLDDDVIEALVDDLASRLAPHTDSDGIVFPFETLTVTGLAA